MKFNIEDLKNDISEERFIKLKEILQDNGIRISHQRLLILDYLAKNHTHPTADKIFKDLKIVDPVISQATVYNTLNLFVDKKIIKELDFNMTSKRYEFSKKSHGHFICENCHDIIDFDVLNHSYPESLSNFDINTIEVIYRGICPKCQKDL